MPDRKTAVELIEMGLYWNRPPEELIFLTSSEHMRLHSTGSNNPMAGKDSWEKCSPEERADRARRYSQSMKGKNVGKTFWTDGSKTVFARECPPGFYKKHFKRSEETRKKLVLAQARRRKEKRMKNADSKS